MQNNSLVETSQQLQSDIISDSAQEQIATKPILSESEPVLESQCGGVLEQDITSSVANEAPNVAFDESSNINPFEVVAKLSESSLPPFDSNPFSAEPSDLIVRDNDEPETVVETFQQDFASSIVPEGQLNTVADVTKLTEAASELASDLIHEEQFVVQEVIQQQVESVIHEAVTLDPVDVLPPQIVEESLEETKPLADTFQEAASEPISYATIAPISTETVVPVNETAQEASAVESLATSALVDVLQPTSVIAADKPAELSQGERKPEVPVSKVLPSKSKAPVSLATKKPLAGPSALAKPKTTPSATSKVASTLSTRPAATRMAGTAPKTTTTAKPSIATARAAPSKVASKPTAPTTRTTSTLPKPATSTLGSRLTAASKVGTSTRSTSTLKPATATTRTAISARPATSSTSTTRPATALPKTTSRLATKSSTQLTSAAKPAAAEPKSTATRKPLTTSSRPLTSTAGKSTTSTPTARPGLSKTTGPSPTASRLTRASPATSAAPKIGSVRPTTPAKALPKTPTSGLAAKSSAPKPLNGTTSGSGTKMAVKKPAVPPTKLASVTKTPEYRAQPNGTVKSYSSKRPIGVENSLKQELEDAVMNGLNGGVGGASPVASANTEEVPNVVNGHNGQ